MFFGSGVSFPRWGKRNVVSFHFFELVFEITEIEILSKKGSALTFLFIYKKINALGIKP